MAQDFNTLQIQSQPRQSNCDIEGQRHEAGLPARARINPMPVLVIFLLGVILSGHHQASAESKHMHKYVSKSFPLPANVIESQFNLHPK
jgi:hypothetical protein